MSDAAMTDPSELRDVLAAYLAWSRANPEATVGETPARLLIGRTLAVLNETKDRAASVMTTAADLIAAGDAAAAEALLRQCASLCADAAPRPSLVQ